MLKELVCILILLCGPGVSWAQSTIVYFNGPAFGAAAGYGSRELDLNNDRVPDYSFSGDWSPICTHDIPTSACHWRFYIGGNGTSELLTYGYDSAVQPFSTLIDSNPPPGAAWNPLAFGAMLADSYFSPRYGEAYWVGSLGEQGVGYLGVRFHAADGLHYGWIRVRLPRTDWFGAGPFPPIIEFAPVVMEWAYETRPNTPIRAGATGLETQTSEFKVDFRNADGTPHQSGDYASSGRVQLMGNSLRYELHVAGTNMSADLKGPAAPHSKARPLLILDRPRIDIRIGCRYFYDPAWQIVQRCGPQCGVFFGEVPLSHAQIIQLRRGALYVSVGDGAVIGRILPAPPD